MKHEERLEEWKNLRRRNKENRRAELLLPQILKGEKRAISEAFTLLESSKSSDKLEANILLKDILPFTGKSKRIGITGVPGVGKSSFIEVFGKYLLDAGHKLAVLAIDPSSNVTGGSILGDKTRMNWLSQQENVFIRPSAAADQLGGVARSTKECLLLCEAAGYDYILIETVGVGQSETAVHDMVDFFMLLMLSGAGDELQGMKRGIMELADAVIITKADGQNITHAKRARAQYANALHLFPPKNSQWIPESLTCSSTENSGFDDIVALLDRYFRLTDINGWLSEHRKKQELKVFEQHIKTLFQNQISQNQKLTERRNEFYQKITEGKISGYQAAEEFFSQISS
jgi:LAO/AO transport system kinase